MKVRKTVVALLLLAAFGGAAQAQFSKTREQVRAELMEAIRTGDIVNNSEIGLRLNEINPSAYPTKAMVTGNTRERVQAELAHAIRSGDMVANDESGKKLNEVNPSAYPPKQFVAGKTREQVKAELAEAIRTGDILANDESGQKLNVLYPQRYAPTRSMAANESATNMAHQSNDASKATGKTSLAY
jgi:transposase-like protein